jgi:hypothetical protein
MRRKAIFLSFLVLKSFGLSLAQDSYRYEEQTKASEFAREFFGPAGVHERAPGLDMGRYRAGVSAKIDCGSLDLQGNLSAEFENLQAQIKELLGQNPVALAQKGAMLTTCYAFPTVCAQLRHDFLALQSTINLRAQACRAMDDFIDSSAEKGAKQLRAEAQAECTKAKVAQGGSLSSAMRQCQGQTGLPLRDFQAGLEKKFMTGRQKVLESMAKFAKADSGPTYDFLAGVLGEIEVQEDGYWQPMFAKGMLRPHEVAGGFLAEGEARLCGDLKDVFRDRGGSATEAALYKTAKEKLTKDDLSNLEDLEREDRRLACAALGRSLGQVAAQKTVAEGEAVLASGLLNTAIPNSLRDEYRSRGESAFEALRKSLASEEISPLDEVRRAVSLLAKATREKNRILAGEVSRGRLENYRQDTPLKSDCTDTLSCSEGR